MNQPVLRALLGGLICVCSGLTASPALAAGSGSISTGQTTTFKVPSSPNGFSQVWSFNYPGDNSNLTVDAELGGYDPSFASAIGFNVFDSQHQGTPLETATTQSNQKTNDPQGIEFNYSSGTPGPVSVQFFSYAPTPLTVSMTQGGLVSNNSGSGSTQTPISLEPQGTPPVAVTSGPAAPAPPPTSAAQAPASGGSGLASGQTATFNVPASPNGFTKSWTFSYPGDNSSIIFDSEIGGYDPSFATAVGYNVYDSQHQGTPLEIATTQSNQKTNDPKGIEFVYSSGLPATVTVQFFSYAPAGLNVTLTQGGLISSASSSPNGVSTVTPVTLQG